MARVSVQVPVDPEEHNQAKKDKQASLALRLNKKTLSVIGVILVVLIVGFLINDRNKLKSELNKSGSTSSGQSDALKYQEEIGKIVELPSGQTPSLVPVSDARKLAGENAFFKNAQDGDVVLLYVSQDKSVRAILYRPSTKKVIEATSSATIGSPAANK